MMERFFWCFLIDMGFRLVYINVLSQKPPLF